MNKLWTRDFTILTLGSVISILGNTLAGFAINLVVLDYSSSIFLFVLFMVVFNLPKILVPILAGPLLDSFSRKKTIYTLDFLSAALYFSLSFILGGGYFNFISTFAGSSESLVLPFFKNTPDLGVMTYSLVMGAMVIGRLVGAFGIMWRGRRHVRPIYNRKV